MKFERKIGLENFKSWHKSEGGRWGEIQIFDLKTEVGETVKKARVSGNVCLKFGAAHEKRMKRNPNQNVASPWLITLSFEGT